MEGELLPASRGVGPLLQRDYWAVLRNVNRSPSELMRQIKADFCGFSPPAIVEFTAPKGGIVKGAQLDIRIKPAHQCFVQVVHEDAQSFTLGTLKGHPEAGRITFGAYRNAARDIVFHIRSRARSATLGHRLGFLAIGDALQTNTWTDFIVNAAAAVGARIQGVIHADTQRVDPLREDDDPLHAPTFLAVGD